MLDPRIYRAALVVVALAVLVVAFSLNDQQGPLGTTLAPDAYNAQNAYSTMTRLAKLYPDRRPGSAGDQGVAGYLAAKLRHPPLNFSVSTRTFGGDTADGSRTLETVTATRAGLLPGNIVVLAHRDSLSAPDPAGLSGTATLLELARVLSGESLHRTIVLASTSGSDGSAGAAELARSLPGPTDAVIVLGDLAGSQLRDPIVDPFSDGEQVAPPMLRNTVAANLGSQAGLRPGGTSLAGQIARLAFSQTTSDQGPFGPRGVPAVRLSVSGERGPSPGAVVSAARIGALGRTALQTVNALDGSPAVPAPSAYLIFDGKVIPAWAIRLLVLALILPVLAATVDCVARARRRGHSISHATAWVLAGGLPFALALALVLGSRALGLIQIAPPGPVGAGTVPLHASGVAVLIAVALVIVASLTSLRAFVIGVLGRRAAGTGAGPGGPRTENAVRREQSPGPVLAAALALVLCVVSLAIWVSNPFAAALIVPALHLWMWVTRTGVRQRPALMLVLVLAGLTLPVLVAIHYADALGLGPLGLAWNGLLVLAGGQVGVLGALEWSVVLGCVVSVVAIALRGAREERPLEAVGVTIRGPVGYAGPGSLGGTKSALRR